MISLGSRAAPPVRTSAVLTCSWMAFLCLQPFYGGVLPAAWVICGALFLFPLEFGSGAHVTANSQLLRVASAQIALTLNGNLHVRAASKHGQRVNERSCNFVSASHLKRVRVVAPFSHFRVLVFFFFCTIAIISHSFIRSPFLLGGGKHPTLWTPLVTSWPISATAYSIREVTMYLYSPSIPPCKLLTKVPAHYLFPVLRSTLQ